MVESRLTGHGDLIRRMPRLQRRILMDLAARGAGDAYEIASRSREHYSSVRKALRSLQDISMIAVAGKHKARRGPEVRTTYDLTRFGIWACLHRGAGSRWEARSLARAHGSKLPWILGHWTIFVQCKVEALALNVLKQLSPYNAGLMNQDLTAAMYLGARTNDDGVERLDDPTWAFYLAPFYLFDKEQLRRWFRIFQIDLELAGKFLEILKDLETSHVTRMIEMHRAAELARSLLPSAGNNTLGRGVEIKADNTRVLNNLIRYLSTLPNVQVTDGGSLPGLPPESIIIDSPPEISYLEDLGPRTRVELQRYRIKLLQKPT